VDTMGGSYVCFALRGTHLKRSPARTWNSSWNSLHRIYVWGRSHGQPSRTLPQPGNGQWEASTSPLFSLLEAATGWKERRRVEEQDAKNSAAELSQTHIPESLNWSGARDEEKS
jgi:hypothetical protein